MLQISMGKFYEKDEVYVNEGKGILYSNYSWHSPIETCVGILEPVDRDGNITSYVFSYKNKMEKGGILIRTGDHEIIEQFKLIFSFYFQCFSDPDRNTVEINCRETKKNMNDEFVPNDFVGRIFESKINGTEQEVEQFKEFIKKIIGLKREKYKKLIQCLNAYNNSLLALNYNYELAYSLLIYCLESISQSFDDYEPQWEDYNQEVRIKLERAFLEIETSTVEEIKNILINESHLKLQTRFVNFISQNIDQSFFIEEASEINSPLKKSELGQVLRNAYDTRSKYVHSLQSIMKQLKIPSVGSGEVFRWIKNPFITYKGLLRLTHHVIKNYFSSQDFLEFEEYNWRSDLPGIVEMQLSETFWISNIEGFKQENATVKLNGFLSQLQQAILYEEPVTDLTKLMEIYEDLIPQAKKKFKLQMFVTYILYNLLLTEELRLPNYQKVISKYDGILTEQSLEAMLVHSLVNDSIPFQASECEAIYNKYEKKKFNSLSVSLPLYIEVLIIIKITNLFHTEKKYEKYGEWLSKCILEVAGNYKLQEYLVQARESKSYIDYDYLTSKKFFLSNPKEQQTNKTSE